MATDRCWRKAAVRTGEEVANEDIVKGYKVDTDNFIEVTIQAVRRSTRQLTARTRSFVDFLAQFLSTRFT